MAKAPTPDPLADAIGEEEPLVNHERELEIRAKAEAMVREERIREEEKRILNAEVARLRRAADPVGHNDDVVNITLDLAPHQPDIRLDGVVYYHGMTYKVKRRVADTMREIAARGWKHQDEIDGKSMAQHYQRPRNEMLSGGEVRH